MSIAKHGHFNKPVEDWSDIEDSELRTRLIQRGVDPVTAKGWVRDREITSAAEEITAALLLNEYDQQQERELKAFRDNAKAILGNA